MKVSGTLTADGTITLGPIHKVREHDNYFGTISILGTFGSGTAVVQMSPDGGTTKITQKTESGSAYSATANDTVNIRLGRGSTNSDQPILYVTLTGSTNPSLTAILNDNR